MALQISTWTWLAFSIGILAASAILLFSFLSYFRRDFQFWPPERNKPWQYHAFWLLFRIFVVSLIALCILDYRSMSSAPTWFGTVGWPLAAAGFGAALYLTNFLGWKTAYSIHPEGLRTDGAFARSRNPIYLVTWVGMIGLGLAVMSLLTAILLALWALFYWLAPLLEEPWLEREYGNAYLIYKQKTPRFV